MACGPANGRRSDATAVPPRVGQQGDCAAISVQGADVDVGLAGFHAHCAATRGKISVDESADIFVGAAPGEPQPAQLLEYACGHLERTPDPVRSGVALLDLNLEHLI